MSKAGCSKTESLIKGLFVLVSAQMHLVGTTWRQQRGYCRTQRGHELSLAHVLILILSRETFGKPCPAWDEVKKIHKRKEEAAWLLRALQVLNRFLKSALHFSSVQWRKIKNRAAMCPTADSTWKVFLWHSEPAAISEDADSQERDRGIYNQFQ